MSWMENDSSVTLLFNFAFFYPVVMAFFWMVGGNYYYLRRERGGPLPARQRLAAAAHVPGQVPRRLRCSTLGPHPGETPCPCASCARCVSP